MRTSGMFQYRCERLIPDALISLNSGCDLYSLVPLLIVVEKPLHAIVDFTQTPSMSEVHCIGWMTC